MKQLTVYHESILKSFDNISVIRAELSPRIKSYRANFEKGEIDISLIQKLHESFNNLEIEVVHLNKLFKDVIEDCRDIYEGMT